MGRIYKRYISHYHSTVQGGHYFPVKEEKAYFSIIADEIRNGEDRDE